MTKLPIATHHEVTINVKKNEKLTYDLYHVKTLPEVEVVCDWIETQERFLLDTETSGIDVFENYLATIQIGNPFAEEPVAFFIDFRFFMVPQLKRLLDLIADPARVKLGQNIKFEYKYLAHRANCHIRNLQDTQIAEMIIRAGLFAGNKDETEDGEEKSQAYSHTSMDALCQRYLGIKIDKDFDLRTSFFKTRPGEYTLKQLVYACGDVIYPAYIWQEQEKELETRALKSVARIEMQAIPVTALAELRGIPVDTKAWRALYQEAEQKRFEIDRKIHQLIMGAQQRELFDQTNSNNKVLYPKTAAAVNFDSPTQVQWAIKSYCDFIKWPIKIVTNKAERSQLRRKYGAEWLDYRFNHQHGEAKPLAEFMGETLDFVPEDLIPQEQYCILVSTDKDTLRLARLRKQLPKELIDLLLEYSKQSILVDGFGNEFIKKNVKKDGRIHSEFHQCKTSTGRYSSTPNLQNIPKDPRYRKCFVPAPGYKFVIADYSQQEPRLTAQESLDPVYLSTYQKDEDLYLNVLESMLGYKPDINSKDPELAARSNRDRQLIKQVVLAMAYRMGPAKLYRKLLLALEDEILAGRIDAPTYIEVKGLHTKFLQTFTKLVEYQDYCSSNASHTVKNPRLIWDSYLNEPVTWATGRCGRKRFFTADYKGVYTAASNSPIQGCSATMTKAASIMILNYIDKTGIDAGVVDTVHDELVYECREDQAQDFAKVVKQLMEKAEKFYLPDVPAKADYPKNTNGIVDFWTKELAA